MDLQKSPTEGTSSDKHDLWSQFMHLSISFDKIYVEHQAREKRLQTFADPFPTEFLEDMTRTRSVELLQDMKAYLIDKRIRGRTIEVQALSGETCKVEAWWPKTVRDVKEEACEKLRLSDKNYTLVHNGKELDDMSFVRDLNIISGSKLQLLPRTGSGLGDSVKRLFAYYRDRAQRLVEWFPDLFMDMSRGLTEKDLSRISQAIGSGWQHLGTELGISKAAIDQICEDNNKTSMKIFNMLRQWSIQASVNATVNTLHNAMKNCRKVTFDMNDIERVFSGI